MKKILLLVILCISTVFSQSYKIVDTGQEKFFNNINEIDVPEQNEQFYGQDAQFNGYQPNYTDNSDGTITDNVTGLMWSRSLDITGDGIIDVNDKLTYPELSEYVKELDLGGYNDWRIPTIKELYSLVMFYGKDPSGLVQGDLIPFINTDYFEFGYGDESAGERLIDAQMATTTFYKGSALNSDEIMFGYNFADGRIKGYPYGTNQQGDVKGFYVYFVRGNENYGVNEFVDNSDGTITDNSTGLMWMKDDSKEGMNWVDALTFAQTKNSEKYLGFSDWRLPNAKELQSIVDYERSPQQTNSPAIDPVFFCSEITDEGGNTNYPFYWTSTTHENMVNGSNAVYICFGEALGFMQMPPNSGNYTLMDVHGAGAQRSDPKTGNIDQYPYGHGPQGDVVRIDNYVRLVRNIVPSDVPEDSYYRSDLIIYPNPAYDNINFYFNNESRSTDDIEVQIINSLGQTVFVDFIDNSTGYKNINISQLQQGLYYIKAGNKVGKIIVNK